MAQSYGKKYKQVSELLNSYIKIDYETKFNKEEQEIVSFFVKHFRTEVGYLRCDYKENKPDNQYNHAVSRLAQNIVDALIEDARLENKTK